MGDLTEIRDDESLKKKSNKELRILEIKLKDKFEEVRDKISGLYGYWDLLYKEHSKVVDELNSRVGDGDK